ncbi:MAG: 50S ribosomal protein L18 [Deltaproteobacteria bacterium]|nr:50S ribosomal protein L18 [Deltaproteobacteria bacterium]MDD9873462.1 50S ribosomal protein L18 [Deltaproteobacteria bacterium]
MKRKIRNRKRAAFEARKARVVRQLGRSARPRLTVYRSARHIYAQLVDPASGRTLGAVSSRNREIAAAGATGNLEAAARVGRAIAELAREKQIESVVFNRNGFLYHGRVKALAETARENGLKF